MHNTADSSPLPRRRSHSSRSSAFDDAPARPQAAGYTGTAVLLHWLMAVGVLGQLALGLWMINLPDEPRGLQAGWFNLHKSTGIVLLALVLVRLAWRAAHLPPPLPAAVPRWKRQAAAVTHRLLYLCLLVAPVSGFLGSSFSPYPIRFFGTPLPRWIAPWEAGKEAMSALHLAAVLLLAALVLLHVAGALSHAIRRDGVFSRMAWPKPPSPRQPP